MKIEGAIFDLDGTLLDSMFIWDTIGADYLISRGIEPESGLNKRFKSMSLYQAARYYQREYGLKDSTDAIMNGVNQMIEHLYAHDVMPKRGVLPFLKRLKARNAKMCVATATDRHLVEAALSKCGIRGYFEEVFTCTCVGHGKDEPDIFHAAHAFLGTPKENTWVFEDALYAVTTAKKAGFGVVGVFDKSEADANLVQKTADFYIHSFQETEDIFL